MRAERAATGRMMLVAMLLCSAACERFDEAPREVAATFWGALAAGDLAAAVAVSDAANEAQLRELAGGLALEDVTLQEILRNEANALVTTRGHLPRGALDLEFNTHLRRSGESWRVDVDATERELRRSALAVSFEDVRDSIRESTDLLVEEFEKRALEASESLREALRDLEESLREETAPAPFEDQAGERSASPRAPAKPGLHTAPAI